MDKCTHKAIEDKVRLEGVGSDIHDLQLVLVVSEAHSAVACQSDLGQGFCYISLHIKGAVGERGHGVSGVARVRVDESLQVLRT